jgi:hypothetical protein
VLGYPLIFLTLGLIGVVWAGLACLPLRPAPLRIAVLTAHVAASLLLIMFVDDPWQLWALVFGPGLLLAVWAGLARLPLRPAPLAIAGLAAHVAASLLLIALMGDPWQLWAMVFGPGLVVAMGRMVGQALAGSRDRSRSTPAHDP